MLKVKNIFKSFKNNANPILNNISFVAEKSTISAIIGSSGSGKSTLLQIISNINKPCKGKVLLNNINIENVKRTEIGMIFQNHNLLEDITIEENIAIPLLLTNLNSKDIDIKVKEIMNLFQINHIKDLYFNQISGGQSQRVAIARAVINNPKILIADEPTSSLDDKNSEIIMNAFTIARDTLGTTIIFSTHKKDNLLYADNIIKID